MRFCEDLSCHTDETLQSPETVSVTELTDSLERCLAGSFKNLQLSGSDF